MPARELTNEELAGRAVRVQSQEEMLPLLETYLGADLIGFLDAELAEVWAKMVLNAYALALKEGDKEFLNNYHYAMRGMARSFGVVIAREAAKGIGEKIQLLLKVGTKILSLVL